jgi:hypothetical protein
VRTARYISRSQPGQSYKTTVRNGAGVCDCFGFRTHGRCWHVKRLIVKERNMNENKAEERALVAHEGPAPVEVNIPPRSLPTSAELSVMGKIAQTLVQARGHSVPKEIDTMAKAAAVLLAGWELGVKPMTAFRHIFVVNGRTEPDAQIMMGLVRAKDASAQFIFHEYTAERCKVELRRGGESIVTVEYTLKDATASGQLAKGGPWKQYPRDMCAWAAVKRACRLGAADLINAIPGIETADAADLIEEALPAPEDPAQDGAGDAFAQERDAEYAPELEERRFDADEEAAYAEAEAQEEVKQAELIP